MPRKTDDAVQEKSKKAVIPLQQIIKDKAIKEFGVGKVKTWTEFTDCVYGVPIVNNLPLQFLLGVDVMPLGRSMSVVGSWGTTKSSFCWYLSTLFMRMQGLVPFIDSEFKSNPDQIKSIMRSYLQVDFDNYFSYHPAHSIDEILDYMLFYASIMKQNGGKDTGTPLLLVVDSIGMVTTEDNIAKREDKGKQTGFGAARTANQIKEDMQIFGPQIENLPVLCLLVNHQKVKTQPEGGPKKPMYGPPPTTEAGGTHKDFAYTWLLQIAKGVKEKTLTGGVTPHLLFSMKKNSLGKERLKPIEVPYRSLKKVTAEGFEEDIWYDWDHALTLLLTNDKQFPKAVVNEVLDIKADGKTYSSKRLGVAGLNAHDFGAAIHANAELVRELQDKVLEIRRKPTYGTLLPDADKAGRSLSEGDEGVETEADGEEQE